MLKNNGKDRHFMYNSENTAVLIPAYNPDDSMAELISEIVSKGFTVVVVNDGSDKGFDPVFAKVKDLAEIVVHSQNQGKGAALKTGIEYLRDKHPEFKGFVTADADGQHSVKDISRVAEKLQDTDGIVLGMRNLDKNIPFKSKFGNVLSKYVFGIVTGSVLEDNQAGLRGFSMKLCDWLLSIDGRFYEYEMYMLVKAVRENISIIKLPIETIYKDNNSTTHFKPVLDTLRIQGSLIRNGLLSLLMYVITIAICSLGMCLKLPLYQIAIGVFLVFVIHIAVRKKEINIFWGLTVVIKYILMAAVICLMYILSDTVIPGIIVSILLIPLISYLAAYFTSDKVDF